MFHQIGTLEESFGRKLSLIGCRPLLADIQRSAGGLEKNKSDDAKLNSLSGRNWTAGGRGVSLKKRMGRTYAQFDCGDGKHVGNSVELQRGMQVTHQAGVRL